MSSFASSTLARVSASSTTSAPRAVIASSGQTAAANTRALPRGGKVVARIRLGRGAPAPLGGGALTVGEGAVWAMSDAESTLMRIDPARNAVVARIKVSPPEAAAAGDGAVWLTYPSNDTVSRIDPATNKVTASIHVGPQPDGIAISPGAVWVANAGGPSVSRIDPATNRVVATIRVGPKRVCCAEHMSLTATGGTLWVAVPNANEIVRIDPTTNTSSQRSSSRTRRAHTSSLIRVASGRPAAVAPTLLDGSTPARRHSQRRWVSRMRSGSRSHSAPCGPPSSTRPISTGSTRAPVGLIARLHVGGNPVRLGVGFGSIWVNDDNGRVLRIQADELTLLRRLRVFPRSAPIPG